MNKIIEPSFRESVDLMFDRASSLLDLAPGLEEKIKVWFQAGLHGNEPASTEGILYLINQLLIDDDYKYLFERITLAIIPMANIDGYEKRFSNCCIGADMMRS